MSLATLDTFRIYFLVPHSQRTVPLHTPRSPRSDKLPRYSLLIQPWPKTPLANRSQGFAPHAEHWRYPQNYCICPACPLPCCVPATPFPLHQNTQIHHFFTVSQSIANHSIHVSSMLPPQLGEPASFVHAGCSVLVSYLVRLRESPQLRCCFA